MSIQPPLRTLAVVGCLWTLGGCAATTPPPRFGTVSPADPGGPEGALPAATPMLTGKGELAEAPAAGTGPADAASATKTHEHVESGAAKAIYTCSMHPEVEAAQPGHCPVCGMTLVQKPARTKARP